MSWNDVRIWFARDWDNALSPTAQKIVLAASIIGVALILANGFRDHAIDQSRAWTRNLPYADSVSLTRPVEVTVGTAAENARLGRQIAQVRARANVHLGVMNYFYSRYFASVTLATILAIAAAACLLHIARAGWNTANQYILTAFLATAGLALLFRASPMLYKQEDNIAANKDLYTRYVGLDNDLQSYVATMRFRSTDSMPAAGVIQQVDSIMFSLRDLPLGFSRDHIPDYLKIQLINAQ